MKKIETKEKILENLKTQKQQENFFKIFFKKHDNIIRKIREDTSYRQEQDTLER